MISFALGFQLSVIGLTGGIGTGKTTCGLYIRDVHGFALIDSDIIARAVVKRGTSGFRAIVSAFGESVVDSITGELDREALGQIIFQDRAKKRILERITHPRIVLEILKRIVVNRLMGKKVVADIPLLFDSSASPILYYMCSDCLLVDAEPNEQISRVRLRNPNLTETDITNRINSQLPRRDKLKFADYVLLNNSQCSISQLHAQIDLVIKGL